MRKELRMIKPEFNLLDEPWIRVRTRDCRVEEVSLKDVFVHAHEYEDLAGETAAQDVTMLRLLLAVFLGWMRTAKRTCCLIWRTMS